jgi:hypothetical protein
MVESTSWSTGQHPVAEHAAGLPGAQQVAVVDPAARPAANATTVIA